MLKPVISAIAILLATPSVARSVAVTHVTAIDPASETVRRNVTVLIESGRIVRIDNRNRRVPPGVRQLDGRGKFLIPGLWDAHAHLSKTGRGSLNLYVANGITGVRDMGSNLEEVKGWRDAIAAGQLIGPRIKFSGPMLEAKANVERMRREATVENVDRQRIGVANMGDAEAAVAKLAAAGVDQIKVRTATDLATFNAIVQAAAARGLPVAAHPNGTPDEMLASGLRSAEHWLDFPPLDKLSPEERAALFKRVATARMHVSNTAIVLRNVMTPYEQAGRILANTPGHGDARRKYVCGYLLKDWAEQLEEAKEARFGPIREVRPGLYRDFREMYAAGVPLLAGSDAAVLLTYAGFSLHDQLELMVHELGFSPMAVLKIATAGVPEYFGERARMGALDVGQVADLVLLGSNPLSEITNAREVSAVITRGKLFERRDLDRLLADVAEDAAGPCSMGSLAGSL